MLIKKLKELQAEKSQDEFAAELGISQSALSMIYSGDRSIGIQVARKITKRYPWLQLAVSSFLLEGDITARTEETQRGNDEVA